jgi:hypothetical protein
VENLFLILSARLLIYQRNHGEKVLFLHKILEAPLLLKLFFMTYNSLARQKRGEVDDNFKLKFNDFSSDYLMELLDNTDAQVRTASAIILGERKCVGAVNVLCRTLVKEKALYTKIAVSEALGKIGLPALDELTELTGKIGKNQHRILPDKTFKKWNYPLPRDIVIRTIVKMGRPALPLLQNKLQFSSAEVASELIDAIGHISFYSGDQSSEEYLLRMLEKFNSENVVVWKIIRALQAFHGPDSLLILEYYFLQSSLREFRWEAARSLGQLRAESILKKNISDPDIEVRQMVMMSLDYVTNSGNRVEGLG